MLRHGDVVTYGGGKHAVLGTSRDKGGRTYVLLANKEDSPTGKAVKPSIGKVRIVRRHHGWMHVNIGKTNGGSVSSPS